MSNDEEAQARRAAARGDKAAQAFLDKLAKFRAGLPDLIRELQGLE